jgi:hypothetical protein
LIQEWGEVGLEKPVAREARVMTRIRYGGKEEAMEESERTEKRKTDRQADHGDSVRMLKKCFTTCTCICTY